MNGKIKFDIDEEVYFVHNIRSSLDYPIADRLAHPNPALIKIRITTVLRFSDAKQGRMRNTYAGTIIRTYESGSYAQELISSDDMINLPEDSLFRTLSEAYDCLREITYNYITPTVFYDHLKKYNPNTLRCYSDGKLIAEPVDGMFKLLLLAPESRSNSDPSSLASTSASSNSTPVISRSPSE